MAFHSATVAASRTPRDVVERQAGVLQHADEDEAAERLRPVPALARLAIVGRQQAVALVVPHGGGGHAGSAATSPIVSSGVVHADHLT